MKCTLIKKHFEKMNMSFNSKMRHKHYTLHIPNNIDAEEIDIKIDAIDKT